MGNASAFEMDALDTRIRELIAYARERDGEDRSLLFRNLIDLFLTGKAPQKQPTRDQLLDVIEALVPHVEPEDRRTVAELVAHMSEPPLDLACRLAKDRPHLVGELLRSASFDEDDIIELIGCTGRDHHHIIASRSDLSANVWIALARATPTAPAFDTQSTLALWRDDLGLSGTVKSEPNVTPFRDPAAIETAAKPVLRADTEASKAPPEAAAPKQATPDENMPSPGGKTAQLRILRTDKDLIADRIEKSSVKMQTGTRTAEAAKPAVAEEPAAPVQKTAMISIEPVAPISLSDPEQGGWRWRSDRDGILLEVSPSAYRYFADRQELTGKPVVDILGLSEKLAHPVSKAIQRRSTIHDAPLTIATTDDSNRFWSLEATPLFSANGGLFEGYEGTMSPVLPNADAELPLAPSHGTSDKPLFREEEAQPIAPTQGEQATDGHKDTIVDEDIDRTLTPPPTSPVANTSSSADKPMNLPGREELMAIAANMIKDMVGNSVAEALEKTAHTEPAAEPVKPKPVPAAPETPPAQQAEGSISASKDEIAATLHILEQALSTLVISGQTANNSALRLQTEIASACLKTLKEQIGAKKTPN